MQEINSISYTDGKCRITVSGCFVTNLLHVVVHKFPFLHGVCEKRVLTKQTVLTALSYGGPVPDAAFLTQHFD